MEGHQISLGIQLETTTPQAKSVECLGIAFENDEAHQVYFTEKLREKLQDPDFPQIEGFPIGEDKDILALSDPPYYTASLAEICLGTGADSGDLIVMCQGLQKQMLIDCETEVYRLKSHLLDLAREAFKGNKNNV